LPEIYVQAIARLAQEHEPEIILLGSTAMGRELAPLVAARLQTGLTAHCIDLVLDENNILEQRIPAYGDDSGPGVDGHCWTDCTSGFDAAFTVSCVSLLIGYLHNDIPGEIKVCPTGHPQRRLDRNVYGDGFCFNYFHENQNKIRRDNPAQSAGLSSMITEH